MIKTIIFDFGDVFINLDKEGTINKAKQVLGFDIITETYNPKYASIFKTNDNYEKGLISTVEFVSFYTSLVNGLKKNEFVKIWNGLIQDFPIHRLEFIKRLKAENKFNLILLSNTNELHINYIKKNIPFYDEFKSCFDAFYLSHEINLRKPNLNVFQFILREHQLNPKEVLFIDDTKENTEAAKQLGINVWNNNPKTEDITDVFIINKDLLKK